MAKKKKGVKKETVKKAEKVVEMEIGKSSSQNLVCVSGRQAQKYSELKGKAGCFITVQAFTKFVEKSILAKEEASSKGGGKPKSGDDEKTTKDSARSDSKKNKKSKAKGKAKVTETVEKTEENIANTPEK